jgi:hypothetical protein
MSKAYLVRFLCRYGPYATGELAGINGYDCRRMEAAGFVEIVEEREDRGLPWPRTEGDLRTDGLPLRGGFS